MAVLALSSPSYGDTSSGEELFNKKCKQCHKTTEQLSIGPGLKDVTKRRSVEWIEKWLIDPKKVLESNDPIAQELKKNFKRVMPKIPEMAIDENRRGIIEYLKTL
jgi:cbb3-type cytochrome oxidase cytochrome c subunit